MPSDGTKLSKTQSVFASPELQQSPRAGCKLHQGAASAKSFQIQTQDWNILHTIFSQQMQIKNPKQAVLPSRNPGARRDAGSSGAGTAGQGQPQGQGWSSHPFPGPGRTQLALPEPGQQRFLQHSHPSKPPLLFPQCFPSYLP